MRKSVADLFHYQQGMFPKIAVRLYGFALRNSVHFDDLGQDRFEQIELICEGDSGSSQARILQHVAAVLAGFAPDLRPVLGRSEVPFHAQQSLWPDRG